MPLKPLERIKLVIRPCHEIVEEGQGVDQEDHIENPDEPQSYQQTFGIMEKEEENQEIGGYFRKVALAQAPHNIGKKIDVLLKGGKAVQVVKDAVNQHEIEQEEAQIEEMVMADRRFFQPQECEQSFHPSIITRLVEAENKNGGCPERP